MIEQAICIKYFCELTGNDYEFQVELAQLVLQELISCTNQFTTAVKTCDERVIKRFGADIIGFCGNIGANPLRNAAAYCTNGYWHEGQNLIPKFEELAALTTKALNDLLQIKPGNCMAACTRCRKAGVPWLVVDFQRDMMTTIYCETCYWQSYKPEC